jgi:DNA ligase (NAD+)
MFMPNHVFEALNEEREIKGEKLFANPRNAAQTMRSADPKVVSSRKLDIRIFNVQEVKGHSFTTHAESLEYLNKRNYHVNSCKVCRLRKLA